jgi:hypothetical protein
MTWQNLSSPDWRADLDALADAIEHRHRNPFHTISHTAFRHAVQVLYLRIPALAPIAVVTAFARLLALIGDGHTRLDLHTLPGLRRLPVQLYAYQDGLAVQQTTQEHTELLGARVLAIDEMPVDEVWARARPLVSCDNELRARAAVPRLLSLPDVLYTCGVTAAADQATLTGVRPDGQLVHSVLPATGAAPAAWVALWEATDAPAPHWRAQPHDANWWTTLPDGATLYAHFGSVRDGPEQPLAAWFDTIFARIARGDITRLIVDIRRNSGGNMALNQPLLHHLIRCDAVNHWGRLFVVIGRDTFSAAMLLAVDLERHTRALFVGEPTGSRPNVYGENVPITLPHSGLTCTVSGLWWQYSHPADDRPWIAPAIPSPLRIADDQANQDPALAASVGYRLNPAHLVSYTERASAWIGGAG